MKLPIRTFAALFAVTSLAVPARAATTSPLNPPDTSTASLATFPTCESDEQLDCVIGVGIVDDSGKYWPGIHDRDVLDYTGVTDLGSATRIGRTLWQVNAGAAQYEVAVAPNAESPLYIHDRLPDGRLFRFGAIRTMVEVTGNPDVKVRFAFRTSWLKPLNLGMFAADAAFREIPLTHGTKWVFEGRRTPTSAYTSDWPAKTAANAPADLDGSAFYFVIDHAGETDELSPFPTKCSDIGYTAESSNATGAGMPWWNSTKNALEFNIASPHTNTRGMPNFGYFRFWVTEAYLNCRWPENTLATAPNVQVQVLDANGDAEVATTVVERANGRFYLAAAGFHYSTPTIRVTATTGTQGKSTSFVLPTMDVESATTSPAPIESPSPSPSASPSTSSASNTPPKKLASIRCTKAGKTKKVTAVKPKCPTGWKRVK